MIRTLSVEEVRALITDEMAKREGYLNAEMMRKELRLGDLILRWQHDPNQENLRDCLVLFEELIQEGWNPHSLEASRLLSPELIQELPPEWHQ
jgi:hypothetical protein